MTPVDLTETKATAERVAVEWGLRLGAPFALSRYSYVAPVADDAVLKVSWAEDEESLDESDALRLWGGNGAVQLLRADKSRRALLEERAMPGDDISGLPEHEATAVAVDIATKLWVRAGEPFRWVGDYVPRWLDDDQGVLTPLARELYESLGVGREWLVHGDFHHHNILRHGDRFVLHADGGAPLQRPNRCTDAIGSRGSWTRRRTRRRRLAGWPDDSSAREPYWRDCHFCWSSCDSGT